MTTPKDLSAFVKETTVEHAYQEEFDYAVNYEGGKIFVRADSEYDAKENAFIYLNNVNKGKDSLDCNETV